MASNNNQINAANVKPPTPQALAVAKYLRHHPDLKNKSCVLNDKRHEYFRVKRALRVLESDEYKKKQQAKGLLPAVKSREDAVKVLALLPTHMMALRVEKKSASAPVDHGDHQHEAKKQNKKLGPQMEIVPEQAFLDDYHYVWLWTDQGARTYLGAIILVVVMLAAVMFPLWPSFLRKGFSYVSMLGIGFIVFVIVTAIFRLILYVITLFTHPPGLWIFPNLFADVGVIESFFPFYEWDIKKEKKKKAKKSAVEQKQQTPSTTPSATSTSTVKQHRSSKIKS